MNIHHPPRRARAHIALPYLIIPFLLAACGGGAGGGGSDPVTTALATDRAVAARTQILDPGNTCPNGGILVETGIDENGNGLLDDDEVDETHPVCNGQPGPQGDPGQDGKNALVTIDDEPAGPNCPAGGKKIRAGTDENGNGTLDDDEAETFYVCNGQTGPQGPQGTPGQDGRNSLVAFRDEPPGANCPYGGMRVESGLDDDPSDGLLQAHEVDQVRYVCTLLSEDFGWQTPMRMEAPGTSDRIYGPEASSPVIASNEAGHLFVAWIESNGAGDRILKVRRYTPQGGWERPEAFFPWLKGLAYPQLAVDAQGNALIVWSHRPGTSGDWSLSARAYDVDNDRWSDPELLVDGLAQADTRLAADPEGNAVLLWKQAGVSLWAKRHLSGFGWGSAQRLNQADVETISSFDVAMDHQGNAMVVWHESDPDATPRHTLWANYLDAEANGGIGAWRGLMAIPVPDPNKNASQVGVAMNAHGQVRVAYAYDATDSAGRFHQGIASVAYDAADDQWDTPILHAPTGINVSPTLALDTAGDAWLIWSHYADSAFYTHDLWGTHYDAATGTWQPPTSLTHNLNLQIQDLRLVADGQGGALAVWTQYLDTYITDGSLWSVRFAPGFGWGRGQPLEHLHPNLLTDFFPSLVATGNGNAALVWQRYTFIDKTTIKSDVMFSRWLAP